ncbi:Hsp20/alpha crystallin family protein [Halobacterium zhouii]|uniref:Hsp20/alpha crystallin family protein n=1 Tax=Halobacterium zhouii TaxID=2902624 RepID=UPI001E5400CA|nr:Hsp20/alpha crystallin family protein [Halobacterium zhouii]
MRGREFAEAVGGAVARRVGRAAGRFQEEAPLAVDVLESDDEYLVVFDAPGVTASDVQVNYVGNTVRVRIDRFRQYREGFEMQFPGRGLSMDGEATLPADAVVDAEHARAELQSDGTLHVYLPKGEDDGTTGVPVTEHDESGQTSESQATDDQSDA